jgi:hypothetical protein
MADFFGSEKTPWDEPTEVVVWVLGSALAAFFLHNVMRKWKRR